MMFQKKIDRAMNWLKDQNRVSRYNSKYKYDMHDRSYEYRSNEYDTYNKCDCIEASSVHKEREEKQRGSELEKKDILALILSALMVFGPVILALFGIAILMYI